MIKSKNWRRHDVKMSYLKAFGVKSSFNLYAWRPDRQGRWCPCIMTKPCGMLRLQRTLLMRGIRISRLLIPKQRFGRPAGARDD